MFRSLTADFFNSGISWKTRGPFVVHEKESEALSLVNLIQRKVKLRLDK